MLFQHYLPAQRERLQRLVQSQEWSTLLATPASLDRLRAERLLPPKAPAQLAGATSYLKERNGERVRALIRDGVTDEETLLGALGNWHTALSDDAPFPILFIGLIPTLDCSFEPRCLYCNQAWVPRAVKLDQWKAVLTEVAKPTPPYVYLTGGEPLVLREEIWGDDGLVAFATRLGCAVNINTNATLISPEVALQLVKVGTAKLHISLDTADPQLQAQLLQGRDRVEALWRGIFNLQVARELLDANHPQVHINCVVTRLNLSQFPELLRFLLDVRKTPSSDSGGKITEDAAFGDFAFHLIPVGGGENAPIRPTAAEWKRFYTETWDAANRVWQDYQAAIGVPEADRKALADHVPFANAFRRVDHRMGLDDYCARAAEGSYWQGALGKRCYVAPSQAFILPDGSQHWCGAHAIRRPPPLGNVLTAGVRENIRRNLHRLAELPIDCCTSCAGATCVINQTMERNLRTQIAEWL
jgi:MoaA/NifB/PqqE/SkfB family radical SAM enzyme